MGTRLPHWPGPSWLWLPGRPRSQDAAQTLSPSAFPSCSYTVSKGIQEKRDHPHVRGLQLDSLMTSPRGKHLLHPSIETLRARETCNLNTTRPSCSCLKASCHIGLQPKEAEIELQKTWKILGIFMEVLMTCHGWNNIAQHTAAFLKIPFSISVHTPHQPSSCSSCTPFLSKPSP